MGEWDSPRYKQPTVPPYHMLCTSFSSSGTRCNNLRLTAANEAPVELNYWHHRVLWKRCEEEQRADDRAERQQEEREREQRGHMHRVCGHSSRHMHSTG